MADIFTKENAINLLQNKFILIMGDSNTRAVYTDLIYLLHQNDIVSTAALRKHAKGSSCPDIDKVVRKNAVNTATRYIEEVREYEGDCNIRVRFNFLTRVLGRQMELQLDEIESGVVPLPDIVMINSCAWDTTRWGAMQESTYKLKCVEMFARLRSLVDPAALVLWNTTLPLGEYKIGGFVVKQLDFITQSLRFTSLEANLFIAELCKVFYFDVVDLHYHMRFQLSRRCGDGVHWEPHAMRHITCILLTHIALSFDAPLPNVVPTQYLAEAMQEADKEWKDDCQLSSDSLADVTRIVTKLMVSPNYAQEGLVQQIKEQQQQVPQERTKKTAKRYKSSGNANLVPLGGGAMTGTIQAGSTLKDRLGEKVYHPPPTNPIKQQQQQQQGCSRNVKARLDIEKSTYLLPNKSQPCNSSGALDEDIVLKDQGTKQDHPAPITKRKPQKQSHNKKMFSVVGQKGEALCGGPQIKFSQIALDTDYPVSCAISNIASSRPSINSTECGLPKMALLRNPGPPNTERSSTQLWVHNQQQFSQPLLNGNNRPQHFLNNTQPQPFLNNNTQPQPFLNNNSQPQPFLNNNTRPQPFLNNNTQPQPYLNNNARPQPLLNTDFRPQFSFGYNCSNPTVFRFQGSNRQNPSAYQFQSSFGYYEGPSKLNK